MALHLACRYHLDVAGVFALSSFLNKGSVIYQVSILFGHIYQSFSNAVCKCFCVSNQASAIFTKVLAKLIFHEL